MKNHQMTQKEFIEIGAKNLEIERLSNIIEQLRDRVELLEDDLSVAKKKISKASDILRGMI